jgi:hypothetical protein
MGSAMTEPTACRLLVLLSACLLMVPRSAPAQLVETPTFDAPLLGPLVAGGIRDRRIIAGGAGVDTCVETLILLIGSRGTNRTPNGATLRQKGHAVVFFVLFRCVNDDDVCVEGTSAPLAVEGCSGVLKVGRRRSRMARASVRCKRGVDTSAPGFALSADGRARVDQAFPDLGGTIRWRFLDRNAGEASGRDLDEKLRNLDVHALEDIVGTYLEDAELPMCAP